MKAIVKTARGGLGGRRLQAVVIGLVVLACTAASVLSIGMLADTHTPFDKAFAAQHGADVTADISATAATPAQIAATAHLHGVTTTAGPFPEVSLAASMAIPGIPGITPVQVQLVGRPSPGGPVDDLTLKNGHWPTAPGQVVWSESGPLGGLPVLGAKVTMTGAPGQPVLTIVGMANSITGTSQAWVLPSEIAALTGPGAQPQTQMLYDFAGATSAVAVSVDIRALEAALPGGAVANAQSYWAVKLTEQSNIAPWVPFIVAFGILALIMSVLIVANVVGGAVIAGTTRIGVMKSIGFTPVQVVLSYVLQVTMPALAGCVAGAVCGVLLAIPILSQNASVYQVGSLSIPLWVVLTVPLGILAVTGIGALLPALRAGRMSAIAAIATGRAPRPARGYLAHRLLGRAQRVPRAVTIGLAAPFARPARTMITALAILFGAVAVTFGAGLGASLDRVWNDQQLANTAPVRVMPMPQAISDGKGKGTVVAMKDGLQVATPAEQAAIAAGLTAEPGTAHWVAVDDQDPLDVSGLSQQLRVTAFAGDASWAGLALIKGQWYAGADSVDVNTFFLTLSGASVGSTYTLRVGERSLTVRIAGEVFGQDTRDPGMYMSMADLAVLDPAAGPTVYWAGVRPGVDPQAYANAVSAKLSGSVGGVYVTTSDTSEFYAVIGLVAMLTVLLIVVAGLGVLNTVVLQQRERVHDLGVFKSVGMTPQQVIAMVLYSVAVIGLLAGVLAVPLGVLLHHRVVPVMAHGASTDLPPSVITVYSWWGYVALGLAGLVVAVAAALGPAGWAARTRTAFALRAE